MMKRAKRTIPTAAVLSVAVFGGCVSGRRQGPAVEPATVAAFAREGGVEVPKACRAVAAWHDPSGDDYMKLDCDPDEGLAFVRLNSPAAGGFHGEMPKSDERAQEWEPYVYLGRKGFQVFRARGDETTYIDVLHGYEGESYALYMHLF
ncbi:hypothetical protein EON79_21185 [bacterium]|nr:MAG: hypothetical protein EON79_21185 [bacterium]